MRRRVFLSWVAALLSIAACTSNVPQPKPNLAPSQGRPTTSNSVRPVTTATSAVSNPSRTRAAAESGGRARAASSAAPRAPASGASIAGCPLFPADNPWRRDISHDPLNAHSAAWVASVGSGGFIHPDFGSNPSYGIPYSVVSAGQPTVTITFDAYGDESDPGPYPIPSNARIEGGGDRHVLVASGDCHIYELYGAARRGAGWTAASGAVFNLASNALRPAGWTSADAAGLPILPGLVRRDEVASGHIDHALRFTVARTQRGYIQPATHEAGSTTSANVAPMGARFRLKASFDINRYHGAARVILKCLQTYGMYVADNGSNWFLSGATDPTWNDDDLNQLKSVPGSAFDVVDSGAVRS